MRKLELGAYGGLFKPCHSLGTGKPISRLSLACAIFVSISFSFNVFATVNAHGINQADSSSGQPMEQGLKLLGGGKFEEALEFFNQQARDCPDSAEAHLGRACALRKLNRTAEASKEYQLALLLNPNEMVQRKCAEGLKELKELQEPKMSDSPTYPGNSANGFAGKHSKDFSRLEPPVPSTFKSSDVEKSLGDIMKQSADRIKSVHSESEAYANNIYKSSAAVHSSALERIRREIAEMSISRAGRRFSDPSASALQAELNARATRRFQSARSDYDLRRREAQSRAMGIKESAEGLQSQMMQRPSETSGIYMIPAGTNLYVRNYAHFDPVMPEPPEPLRAIPLKLPEVKQMEEAAALKQKTSSASNKVKHHKKKHRSEVD